MAVTAEIIFVGLCSIINARNQDTSGYLPPPSAIVMKRLVPVVHYTFIAFDADETSMTGETATPVSSSHYSAVDFKAGGEELAFNDDHTRLPAVDSSFDGVANFNTYSGIASPTWITDYIPKPNNLPKPDAVAAYVEFGGGTISAERLTKVKYDFTVKGVPADKDRAQCYQREVHYKFTPTGDGLLIEAHSLVGGTKRSMLFKPKGNVTNIKVWIGSSMDPYGDFVRKEPQVHNQDGEHFRTFYESEQRPDNVNTDPIPRPVAYDCAGNPVNEVANTRATMSNAKKANPTVVNSTANHPDGEGDPDVGLCGPDSRP